jgi:hypothetical protein
MQIPMMIILPMIKSIFILALFLLPYGLQAQMKSDLFELRNEISEIEFSALNYFSDSDRSPSPTGAMLRSFILPGWGQHYVDSQNWSRGLIHLVADLALIGTYTGYNRAALRLENNLKTFANHHAGASLNNRSRDYLLNVAEFSSISAYNDYQLRSRNWDKIYEVNTTNSWEWDSDSNRLSFLQMDAKAQGHRQQLPAVLSLLVINRIIAGINAFSEARVRQQNHGSMSLSLPQSRSGLVATYRISF